MHKSIDFSVIRNQFPICKTNAYFASCSKGALSFAVKKAIDDFLISWETLGAPWEERWVGKTEQARQLFAKLIHADADEVAIFSSVSSGLTAVASSFYKDMLSDFEGRNTILIDRSSFPTISHVWMLRKALGIRVKLLPLQKNEVLPDVFAPYLTKKTLGIVLSHINYTTGAQVDIKTIARMAHENGSLLFLDDSQSTGTAPLDVKKLGVDVMVTTGTKYLCTPPGIAFLYVRKGLIKCLKPTVGGWFGHKNLFTHLEEDNGELIMHADERIWKTLTFSYAPNIRRFEQGTPEVIAACGAIPALRLLLDIGLDTIAKRTYVLTTQFMQEAEKIGATFKTPFAKEKRGPLVVIKTTKNVQLAEILLKHNIHSAPRGVDGLRFAFHFYNNEKDIEKTIKILRENNSLLK